MKSLKPQIFTQSLKRWLSLFIGYFLHIACILRTYSAYFLHILLILNILHTYRTLRQTNVCIVLLFGSSTQCLGVDISMISPPTSVHPVWSLCLIVLRKQVALIAYRRGSSQLLPLEQEAPFTPHKCPITLVYSLHQTNVSLHCTSVSFTRHQCT